MDSYIDPAFLPVLKHAGLDRFEALWRADRNWFEKPNRGRRRGKSGICRKEFVNPATGQPQAYFVKFQKNHCYRTLRHPLAGEPTARREAQNLLLFKQHGIPAQNLVYYHQVHKRGIWRAVLITEELRGAGLPQYLETHPLDDNLTRALGNLVAQVHRQVGVEHRALNPKHYWVQDGQPLLIDLEAARPLHWWLGNPARELAPLLKYLRKKRHEPLEKCLLLLKEYLALTQAPQTPETLAARFRLK